MNSMKIQLLAAAAVAGLLGANSAQAAGANYPSVDLQGNGASSIVVVLNKTEGCLGGPNNPTGFGADGSTQTFPAHNYQPVSPTTGNPAYDCAVKSVQPNVQYHYVSTGSGGGKTDWSKFTTSAIVNNPFTYGSHIQYAFSDSAISSTNLSDYAANVPASAGAAIQIPFYVLPIAIAYAPVYGKKDTGSGFQNLSFNVKSTFVVKDGAGNPTGGLRMKKTTYCAIMNGTITNWNDPALKADNGGISLMDANDDTTRWNTTGVPIKLVGRNDNSGTTNLFTRHLDVVCGAGQIKTGAGGTDQLPAGAKGTARYDKQTGALTTGSETAGKFGLVDGSDGIAAVVGKTIPTPGAGATTLGGWLGYVGADWVVPATVGSGSPALFSAALQAGTGTSFKTPTTANAQAAFGTTYLPPESSSSGTYNPGVTANGHRNNPLDWVLPTTATTKLANPAAGYPIVGTTNALLYTCYDSTAKRLAVEALAALQFGKLTKDSTGANIPAALVTSTAKGSDGQAIGILPRNGIAPLPGAWKTAIWETFFQKITSGNNPSSLGLWIQDKIPTTQAQIDGNLGNGELLSNPSCTSGQGA